jgi:hypothetical protein
MGRTQMSIFPADPTKPPTGVYSDVDARALLEAASDRLLRAESELRAATAQFELLCERCRRQDQGALVATAVKDLADRRPA